MIQKITDLYQLVYSYVPSYFKNFYVPILTFFVIWMLFFDTNNMIVQFKQNYKHQELLEEKAYYENKIEEVKEDMKNLQNDNQLIERFAREKYYFRQANEDVYVIVEEEKED